MAFLVTRFYGFGVTILTSDLDRFFESLEGELDIRDFLDFFGDFVDILDSFFESVLKTSST